MQLPTAPIIHARTRDVDFRANLLVVPDWFSPSDTAWCRTYITESTRYFEIVGQQGRKVLFCNDNTVVIGLSIFIRDLYRMCAKEPKYHLVDGTRTNYAFIGFVFPRTAITQPFAIPPSMFLEQFEKYMELRWQDSDKEKEIALTATKVPSVTMDFPEATSVSSVLKQPLTHEKQVFHSDAVTSDQIIAEILSKLCRGWNPAFCSDLPNSTSFLDSHLSICTSSHYVKIQEALEPNYPHRTSTFSGEHDLTSRRANTPFSQTERIVPETRHASTYDQLEQLTMGQLDDSVSSDMFFSDLISKVKEKVSFPDHSPIASRFLKKKQESANTEDPPCPPIKQIKK